MLGFDADENGQTWQQKFDGAVTLSRANRFWGFGICFGAGLLCNALAVVHLVLSDFAWFGGYYSIGAVISILGSCFLWGPCAQLKSMFERIRVVATFVYLGSIGVTLYVALEVQSVPLVILCIVVQTAAYVWYTASYIPYGRQVILSCLKSLPCCPS